MRCIASGRSSGPVTFMVSGPVMVQVLEGDNAIAKNRELMGATDPKKATAGTIRADFADSIDAMPCTARTVPRRQNSRSNIFCADEYLLPLG